MENQTVTHEMTNVKYRIVIERAASTKGVLGYKIEANGDTVADCVSDIDALKTEVERVAGVSVQEMAVTGK